MIVRDPQANADRPDVFGQQRSLLSNNAPPVPGRAAGTNGRQVWYLHDGSLIHHAHPHRQPDVDTTVYHGPVSRSESPVRTDNIACCTRHISPRRADCRPSRRVAPLPAERTNLPFTIQSEVTSPTQGNLLLRFRVSHCGPLNRWFVDRAAS